MAAFQVIDFNGKHGPTVYHANPKVEAYKQCAYIQNILGQTYELTCHEDGEYTVSSQGLQTLTFAHEDSRSIAA